MNTPIIHRLILANAALLLWAGLTHAQCIGGALYTTGTPPCPGNLTVTCIYGGEYVLVDVVAGNTYTFSTCGGALWDTQITLLTNANVPIPGGYNDDACGLQSSVTWTATFTGTIRVLVTQYNCVGNILCADLAISCVPGTPPAGDCVYVLNLYDSFGDGWGSSNVGVSINGSPSQFYTVTGFANQVVFGVNINDVVVLTYNNSGPWQGENTFTLGIQGAGGLGSWGPSPPAGVVYTGTVDCVPPPAPQEDCVGAFTICSNQGFNNNTNNTGNVVDLNLSNQGCLSSGERQGTWYVFSPSTGGNIGLNIAPIGPDDYDWALWGPFPPGSNTSTICPPAGPPIRCSYASGLSTFSATGSYNTGFGSPVYSPPQFATPLPLHTEGAGGDGWTPGLVVTLGQVYLLYIDNFSQSGLAFNLNWDLQNGASLDCTVLPMDLIALEAAPMETAVELRWSTASEHNSHYYEVERSVCGERFETIGTVGAAGYTQQRHDYTFMDEQPRPGLNYYRLRQVDIHGGFSETHVVTAVVGEHSLALLPNPAAERVELRFDARLEGEAILRLMDVRGRTVREDRIRIAPATGSITMPLAGLDAGTYMLHLLTPQGERLGSAQLMKE